MPSTPSDPLSGVVDGIEEEISKGNEEGARRVSGEEAHDVDWSPITGSPQERAYRHEADEVLYGGAAGGGKTDLMLGLSLTRHRRSILFRRESTQTEELEDRLDELVPEADSNRNKGRWTLPDGRFVEVKGVKHRTDWKKYKGRPHDLVGFDELTEFEQEQYRNLIIWNRSTAPDLMRPDEPQRCRVVATTNPPTSEDEMWVVDEWAPWIDEDYEGEKAEPGEIRWYLYGEGGEIHWFTEGDLNRDEEGCYVEVGGEKRRPSSRTFIQAFLTDNPHLGTDYEQRLDALPDELRAAYKHGDFAVRSEVDPFQVIPASWVRAAQDRWRETEDFGPQTRLGVDPARGGEDRTAIAHRHGSAIRKIDSTPGKETPSGQAVATQVQDALDDGRGGGCASVVIDVIGIGSSAYDILSEQISVTGFNGAEGTEKTDQSDTFELRNARSAAYWHLRELLDPSNEDEKIALPPSRELREELAAPRYKVLTSGIAVESKEDIKGRLGRSPDLADVVVYAFAETRGTEPASAATGNHRDAYKARRQRQHLVRNR
jgi:hypothetical protein